MEETELIVGRSFSRHRPGREHSGESAEEEDVTVEELGLVF